MAFLWAGSFLALSGATGEARTFSALRDFQPVRESPFVGYYTETKSSDPAEHGVAIQTPRHHDRPAAADFVYPGPAGTFDLRLLAVAEEDGESVYRLFVGGQDLGERRNAPQTGKRTGVSHSWQDVALRAGTRIRVVFAGHTNGKIPEGDTTAWSRGRWRGLVIAAPPASASPARDGAP